MLLVLQERMLLVLQERMLLVLLERMLLVLLERMLLVSPRIHSDAVQPPPRPSVRVGGKAMTRVSSTLDSPRLWCPTMTRSTPFPT